MRMGCNTMEVFSELDGQHLRFRGTFTGNSAELQFLSGDGRVFENNVDRASLRDILLELTDQPAIDGSEIGSGNRLVSFPLPGMQVLALIGACDAVLQDRYGEGWFTASSLLNAYDLSEDQDYSRVCAPVAAVASDLLYRILDEEVVGKALLELVDAEILSDDQLDQTTLYRFTPEYSYLPLLFADPARRMVMIAADEAGTFELLYFLSGASGSWCFSMGTEQSFVEQVDSRRLSSLFTALLGAPEGKAKFCTQCGAGIGEGNRFCTSCGAETPNC